MRMIGVHQWRYVFMLEAIIYDIYGLRIHPSINSFGPNFNRVSALYCFRRWFFNQLHVLESCIKLRNSGRFGSKSTSTETYIPAEHH